MKASIHFLSILLAGTAVVGCSSKKHFEKMPTVEERVNKYDQKTIDEGMAVTKHGAVVDVKVTDVQQQKKNLEARIEYLEKYIVALKHDNGVLKDENTQLKAKLKNCSSTPATEE